MRRFSSLLLSFLVLFQLSVVSYAVEFPRGIEWTDTVDGVESKCYGVFKTSEYTADDFFKIWLSAPTKFVTVSGSQYCFYYVLSPIKSISIPSDTRLELWFGKKAKYGYVKFVKSDDGYLSIADNRPISYSASSLSVVASSFVVGDSISYIKEFGLNDKQFAYWFPNYGKNVVLYDDLHLLSPYDPPEPPASSSEPEPPSSSSEPEPLPPGIFNYDPLVYGVVGNVQSILPKVLIVVALLSGVAVCIALFQKHFHIE